MKLLRSPEFYNIILVLTGAIVGCVLIIFSKLWLAILSLIITALLVFVICILQRYQKYMEQNKYRFQLLARMGQCTPGVIDYCRNSIKLWWKGRHPACRDCKRSTRRSQAVWMYAAIGHWNEALQDVECSKMWLCFACIERRLQETAKQVHLANESCQHWKTKAEQLQSRMVNLES
jgi:hypothetical protein